MTLTIVDDDHDNFAGFPIDRAEKVTGGVSMGAYGIGGSGKTTLFAEAVLSPHGTPALLVDIDGSSDSVIHLKSKGLDIVKPKDWTDFKKIHDVFKRGGHNYKTYIINNLSVLQEWCLNNLAGGATNPRQIQHYGTALARVCEVVADCTTMSKLRGYNTFYVLWEETEEDKLTGLIRRKVQLFNKLSATLPGLMPMIARISVVGSKRSNYARLVSFAPNESVDSKFNVAPTHVAANIPLEIWWQRPNSFMVDFLATLKEGTQFPVANYTKPKNDTTS